MRKLYLLVVLALLVMPLHAMAQDDDGWIDITGTWAFEGVLNDGSNSYSGEMTVTGFGSVYDTTFTSDDSNQSAPLVRLGNVVAQGFRSEACSPSIYRRLEDGRLFGLWADRFYHDTTGIETLTPINATESFAGRYTMEGMFGDGGTYSQEVTVSVDADAVYTFTIDDGSGNQVAIGRGFAVGDILGIVQTLSFEDTPIDDCGVWVAEFFGDGTYSAQYFDLGVGIETGVLTK